MLPIQPREGPRTGPPGEGEGDGIMGIQGRGVSIELDIETYIDMLEKRRDETDQWGGGGWHIPDGVWDRFCEMLREGITPSDPNPRCVVDNIAVNGDYGALEDNDDERDTVLEYARERYVDENDTYPSDQELEEYIRDNRAEIADGSGILDGLFFWYEDDDSRYGIGVCRSL